AGAVPYVDMPSQHADDAVLRAMRRGVTRRRMAEIVDALREAIPGATLRTTVLVGFPGATEAAFETLLWFLDETRFDRVGSFVYSAEEGTPAAPLPDAVPTHVAEELARLGQRARARLPAARRPAARASSRVGPAGGGGGHGARGAGRGPEPGLGLRLGGSAGPQGPGARRSPAPPGPRAPPRPPGPRGDRRGRRLRFCRAPRP